MTQNPASFTELLQTWFAEYGDWLIAVSVVTFITGALLVPVLVTRIPADYFTRPDKRNRLSANARHPLVRLLIMGVKNLLGLLLILAGIVMLITPGQGIMTLLTGLMIMNYPGKYRLERWLVMRPKVLPAVNWLRAKFNHPPLEMDDRQ